MWGKAKILPVSFCFLCVNGFIFVKITTLCTCMSFTMHGVEVTSFVCGCSICELSVGKPRFTVLSTSNRQTQFMYVTCVLSLRVCHLRMFSFFPDFSFLTFLFRKYINGLCGNKILAVFETSFLLPVVTAVSYNSSIIDTTQLQAPCSSLKPSRRNGNT